MKEPIADAKEAEINSKGPGDEDQPDGGLQNQAKTREALHVKTKDGSLVAQSDSTRRYTPGFTPNSLYWLENVHNRGIAENGWYGDMLDAHVISTQALFSTPQNTSDILGGPDSNPDPNRNPFFGDDLPHSKRDTLALHNDSSTDYFLHDTLLNSPNHSSIANGLPDNVTPEAMGRALLERYSSTGWENQDPVIYGFEVIVDAISSPLLNGSVEEFIDMFENVSEIQSRRRILYDFKLQFQKLFKTRGTVQIRQREADLYQGEALYSDPNSSQLNAIATSPQQQGSRIYKTGRKAYLSHYMYKIDGLHKLNESSLGETKKFVTDWQKDFIKLTFNEDVSGTMAALTHLYKMLYWSRPNQKHIVPENLLRFNCEIVVSEVRNFNRVRNYLKQYDQNKSLSSTNLQIIKDNVSRHVYSLRECQFYFDTPAHEDTIDLSNVKPYEGHTLQFDYKYSSLKFEKWISDERKFGRYVSYHNGALWKLGNRGGRTTRAQELDPNVTGNLTDYSNPRFYNVGANSLRQDGVTDEIELMNISYTLGGEAEDPSQESPNEEGVIYAGGDGGSTGNSEDDPDARTDRKRRRKKRRQDSFGAAKKASKNILTRAAKSAYQSVAGEIKAQIGVRAQLLEDTINKVKNLVGLGGLETDPRNVYRRPYTPVGMGIFFDVRNELYNYWGEEISGIIANASNIINPFGQSAIEGIMPDKLKKANAPSVWFNPLSLLLKKFSDQPSVITSQPGKDGVASQGTLKEILESFAAFKPSEESIGNYKFKDPNVGFGGAAVQPSSDNVKSKGTLEDMVKNNTKWPYPFNDKKFPRDI